MTPAPPGRERAADGVEGGLLVGRERGALDLDGEFALGLVLFRGRVPSP